MASAVDTPPPSGSGLKLKLGLMMFLQFFIWGAWFELGFDYIPKLGFDNDWQLPLIFGAFNVGALVALFFSTQFADRTFSAERFLAFSHLIGGLAILGLFFLPGKFGTLPGEYTTVPAVKPGDQANQGIGTLADKTKVVIDEVDIDWSEIDTTDKEKLPAVTAVITKVEDLPTGKVIHARRATLAPFWPFFLLMLVHSIFYVPTISITNSIAFANLRDPARDFSRVRVWGTIGWIAASWPFIFILVDWAMVPSLDTLGFGEWIGKALGTSLKGEPALEMKSYIFLLAGVASLVLAAFSLALPHTPPRPASGEDALAWLKAMKFLRKPFILVLFLVTFIDAAVHQSFFFWTFTFLGPQGDGGLVDIPANWVGPVMKIGQIAEILTMIFLGYVLKRFGWRTTMILGVLGHAARFAVFAYWPEQAPAILINVLHGVCYAFFFATVYIFVDEVFPKDVRSSAQGLFNVLIVGIGPFVANFLCGRLKDAYTVTTSIEGKVVKAVDYPAVFEYSMAAALAGSIILLLFFHPPSFAPKEAEPAPEEKMP